MSLDKSGLPRIIPYSLRVFLLLNKEDLSTMKNVYGCLASCLSIYRVVKWFPEPDINSIIAPFNGTNSTISQPLLRAAFTDLLDSPTTAKSKSWVSIESFRRSVLMIKPIFHLSENSGPNGGPATLSSWYDAFALFHHPGLISKLLYLYWIHGS